MLEPWDSRQNRPPREQRWLVEEDSGWLIWEFRAIGAAFRRMFSWGQARARRRISQLPGLVTAASIVEGRPVRLKGRISFGLVTSSELVRMVEQGGHLPDFSVLLEDGVCVSVAAADAARGGKLRVLDLWEDRSSGETCGDMTPLLFRQSRFRTGRSVEVCGLPISSVDPRHSVAYRGPSVEWKIVAVTRPLIILFKADPDGRDAGGATGVKG